MVTHMFKHTFIFRLLLPHESMFVNGYEFTRDFFTLIKDFYINHGCIKIKTNTRLRSGGAGTSSNI